MVYTLYDVEAKQLHLQLACQIPRTWGKAIKSNFSQKFGRNYK